MVIGAVLGSDAHGALYMHLDEESWDVKGRLEKYKVEHVLPRKKCCHFSRLNCANAFEWEDSRGW